MMKNNKNFLTATFSIGILAAVIISIVALVHDKQLDKEDVFSYIDDYIAEQEERATAAQAEAAEAEAAAKANAEELLATMDESELIDDDPIIGDPNAPVTIVEWMDFDCYFCGVFHDETFPQIKENYIDTGLVKFVIRDLPLAQIHPNAPAAANFAECYRAQTDDEGYEFIYNYFFDQGYTEDALAYAVENGANEEELQACLENGDYADEILADMRAANELGITGTPGFVVGGNTIVSGAQGYEYFSAIIENELNK